MQRFTPRKPGSNWSKVNIEKVAKLTEAGLMRPGRDGRRSRGAARSAPASTRSSSVKRRASRRGYEERLRANAAAWEYWQARPPGYRRTATFWMVSAKREETAERRMAQLIECSAAGRHVPPLTPARRIRQVRRLPLAAAARRRPGGRMSRFEDPCIITCSISGAVANREQCPAIPYTPEEYAAEAARAVDEGAAMIHIHARTPDGVPSYEVEDFRAITEAILGAVDDVIVNYSTGAIGVPIEKRIEYLRELRPDVAALNMGSMNYAKYSRSRKDFVFKAVFENSFDTIIEFVERDERARHPSPSTSASTRGTWRTSTR